MNSQKLQLKIHVKGKILRIRLRSSDKIERVVGFLREQKIITNQIKDNQIKVMNLQNDGLLSCQDQVNSLKVCGISGVRQIEVLIFKQNYNRIYPLGNVQYQENEEQIRLKIYNYLLWNQWQQVLKLVQKHNISYKQLQLIYKLKQNGKNSQQINKHDINIEKVLKEKDLQHTNQLKLRQQNFSAQLKNYQSKINRMKKQMSDTFEYLMEMVHPDSCIDDIKYSKEISPQTQSLLQYIYSEICTIKSQSRIRNVKDFIQPEPQKQKIQSQITQQQRQKNISKIQPNSKVSQIKKEKEQMVKQKDLNKNDILMRAIQLFTNKKINKTNLQLSVSGSGPHNDLIKILLDKPNFVLIFCVNDQTFGIFSPQPVNKVKSQQGFLFVFSDSQIKVIKPKKNQPLWRKSQIQIILGQDVIYVNKNLELTRKKNIQKSFDTTNLQILGTEDPQLKLKSLQLITVQFNE